MEAVASSRASPCRPASTAAARAASGVRPCRMLPLGRPSWPTMLGDAHRDHGRGESLQSNPPTPDRCLDATTGKRHVGRQFGLTEHESTCRAGEWFPRSRDPFAVGFHVGLLQVSGQPAQAAVIWNDGMPRKTKMHPAPIPQQAEKHWCILTNWSFSEMPIHGGRTGQQCAESSLPIAQASDKPMGDHMLKPPTQSRNQTFGPGRCRMLEPPRRWWRAPQNAPPHGLRRPLRQSMPARFGHSSWFRGS